MCLCLGCGGVGGVGGVGCVGGVGDQWVWPRVWKSGVVLCLCEL